MQGADGPALRIKGRTWNQSEDRGPIAFQLGFLWMRCEQDLCGSSFLEQADVDPGEIEVVEATSWPGFNSTFQFPSFLSNVMRYKKRKVILTTAMAS